MSAIFGPTPVPPPALPAGVPQLVAFQHLHGMGALNTLLDDTSPVVICVYSPACRHCVDTSIPSSAANLFPALQRTLAKKATLAAVDALNVSPEVAQALDLDGTTPTYYIFMNRKQQGVLSGPGSMEEVRDAVLDVIKSPPSDAPAVDRDGFIIIANTTDFTQQTSRHDCVVAVLNPACGPCVRSVPVLKQLKAMYQDWRFCVVNTRDVYARDAALVDRLLDGNGTPTFKVYRGGREIGTVTGLGPEQLGSLKRLLQK